MEALLNEDMEACWQVALKYTPEAAHSDILLDIICDCSSVMCNSIRRVQLPCQEFPHLLAWLTGRRARTAERLHRGRLQVTV